MNDDLYFKDAFTEVDGSINLEVNNLKANCITSNNNNFSLDSDGNLVVNSITTTTSSGTSNIDFDMIYPIGSIYLSVNNVNPSTLFGGVWEQITGYYLYAGNNTGTGGSNVTGATSITASQLPSHSHYIPQLSGSTYEAGAHYHNIGADFDGAGGSARYSVHSKGTSGAGYLKATSTDGNHTHSIITNASYTGATGNNEGHTHTIEPLRYNVFVFKRVS